MWILIKLPLAILASFMQTEPLHVHPRCVLVLSIDLTRAHEHPEAHTTLIRQASQCSTILEFFLGKKNSVR